MRRFKIKVKNCLGYIYLNNCASHIAIVLLFDHANAFTSKCVWTSSKMAEVSDK